MFEGETFVVFAVFTQSRMFTLNYDLVDWQCKSTSMLSQKFSHEWQFCILTAKVFSLERFAVYGNG